MASPGKAGPGFPWFHCCATAPPPLQSLTQRKIPKTDDYGGFEKVGTFGTRLPTDNSQIDTVPGDIVLYQGNSISFFYDNNSWSYTMLGKLDITDVKESKSFLAAGKGKTDIILSLK